MRSSSFSRQNSSSPIARGASDFLHLHDKMANLVPAVAKIVALRKDCVALLPDIFDRCDVLQLDSELLVLAAPAPVFAARLKQKLPQLQNGLVKRGWKINAIRIKVLISQPQVSSPRPKQLSLSPHALGAFAALNKELHAADAGSVLQEAIARLVRHHQDKESSGSPLPASMHSA